MDPVLNVLSADRGLSASVGWISRNLHHFEMRGVASAEEELSMLKPLGELALTSSILLRTGLHTQLAREWAAWAWEGLDSGDKIIQVLACRPDLIALSSLCATFSELGYGRPEIHSFLSYLARTANWSALELPPWRRLDVDLALEVLQISPFPQRSQENLWLAKQPEPWMISNDVAYCITHEVFYVTDFGAQAQRIDPAIREYLKTWLPSWFSIFAELKNMDILSELIMVSACIGEAASFGEAIEHVLHSQHADGLIPSPLGSGRQLICPADTPDRVHFLSNYHTALVGTMALAMTCASVER